MSKREITNRLKRSGATPTECAMVWILYHDEVINGRQSAVAMIEFLERKRAPIDA